MKELGLYECLRILDFGALIILWLVQLVIYPSFLQLAPQKLSTWHQCYTFRVSFILVPLLSIQLLGWILTVLKSPNLPNLIGFSALVSCWGLTFFISVPIHRKIGEGITDRTLIEKLIQTNWIRTVLWSLVFLIGVFS